MNKRVFGRKLSRSKPAREALFSTLTRAMFLSGRIVTTKAKAKAVQGSIEKMVTFAKDGGVAARRQVLSKLDNSREAADLLFQKIGPAFKNRQSGFTRLLPSASRKGDNAQMAVLEWTEKVDMTPKKEEPKEKKVKEEKPVKKEKVVKDAKTKK